ncbi:pyridoxamine 5'-phosphate oxidase family protein [Streptomyces sedi]|uniref:Pyridoxamine 5'-phosphate oxidase N-terminal domain-containing protein n=1 Tax=Streptomyces sedi TaxID=555059 RepID=A0A5C4V2N9_9ACTN|nr:pyridoxamine 5'-phosphate oxidase family protein [Streptomyces sedi]TNM30232.1 hypothetical protein FH715_12795 [Streptomyces sedi]
MAGTAGNGWPAQLAQRADRPGSDGEHALQERLGTQGRADRFYRDQVLDHLNERMLEFVAAAEMFFLATSDRHGECDNTFRAGPAGFLVALDSRTLAWPEYRGNGVHASLGNLAENPHAGLLLLDFDRARIGLHVNGRARMADDGELRAAHPWLPEESVPGRRTRIWVRLEVEEAYIHCAKHIPHLVKAPKRSARDWGTDDQRRKGGDFFGAAKEAKDAREEREAPERGSAPLEPVPPPSVAPPVPASHVPPAPQVPPVPQVPPADAVPRMPASAPVLPAVSHAAQVPVPAHAHGYQHGDGYGYAHEYEYGYGYPRQPAHESGYGGPAPHHYHPAPAQQVPPVPPVPPAPQSVPESVPQSASQAAEWRAEALRALERARRAERPEPPSSPPPSGGWFG